MRTTFDLPDDLFRTAKATAAYRGISLKSLLAQALEKELAPVKSEARRRVKMPLIPSKRPRKLKLNNAQIERLLLD